MIILIGGVGYAGKTLMAQTLLEKYKYSSLSIDHLKMGLYRADIECGFTPVDSSEVIGDKLWPILKGIIMTCVENNQNLIIEGCYLFPEKINELENEYLSNIISFYLGFSTAYVEQYFESKVLENRSIIEERGERCEIWDVVERYVLENKTQKEICEKSNAKYFEIQDDYEEEMKLVYNWIDNEISQKLVSRG